MRRISYCFTAGITLLACLSSMLSAHATEIQGYETAVSDTELDNQRGGQTIDVDELNLNIISEEATLHDNVILSSVTGGNAVGGGAFSGASGIATVIQNSGNQVIIQNATLLNLTLE